MITQKRLDEMKAKFVSYSGEVRNERDFTIDGERIGEYKELKLEVNMLDALISLGIANTPEEAEGFLYAATLGPILAVEAGQTSLGTAAGALVKMGFFIGTLVGKKGVNAKETV